MATADTPLTVRTLTALMARPTDYLTDEDLMAATGSTLGDLWDALDLLEAATLIRRTPVTGDAVQARPELVAA